MAPSRHRRLSLVAAAIAAAAGLLLGAVAAGATSGGPVTISMLAMFNQQPGLQILIPSFERAYPNVKVDVTYAASAAVLYQLEITELAAGNAPDVLTTYPGCGTPVSLCALAKAGYLAPMVRAPWVKRTLPLVLARDKVGSALYAFTPQVSPYGVFTNDTLFRTLGLAVPQTFAQLLSLCAKARAAGVVALVFSGGGTAYMRLADALAITTVYGHDQRWLEQLKAGTATFGGSPGWRQALQEIIELNQAGCFEPGVTGTSQAAAIALFAQGQSLLYVDTSSQKGVIDAAGPVFSYSFRPFPAGTGNDAVRAWLNLNFSASINGHASAEARGAARSFVDFIARPAQNAAYAEVEGGLTQYELLKGKVPGFMASFAPVFADREYVVSPEQTWWNANVALALNQNGVGLLTGQTTVDGTLTAMDAAWRQGPS